MNNWNNFFVHHEAENHFWKIKFNNFPLHPESASPWIVVYVHSVRPMTLSAQCRKFACVCVCACVIVRIHSTIRNTQWLKEKKMMILCVLCVVLWWTRKCLHAHNHFFRRDVYSFSVLLCAHAIARRIISIYVCIYVCHHPSLSR